MGVLFVHVPRLLVHIYMGSLILLYIFVSVHTPLDVLADAPADDGLFISLGRYLSEGAWLGPFNQYTLLRGPGYPAFLAISNWFGTPISLAHALLHCAAVAFFVVVAHKFIRSVLLSGVLFTLLLWHPSALSFTLLRVARDRIYFDELLILVASLAFVLFAPGNAKRRVLFAVLSGVALGWFWLTREEGVWILPALGLMAAVGAFQAHRKQQLSEVVGSLAIVIVVFTAALIGFCTANWWAYGKFVGVDFKEENYQRALGALNSVQSGGTKPFVSITYEAMRRVSEVSPTFASLAPYFNGPGKNWAVFGCYFYPSICDEIGAGMFMFALRAAAEQAGHYSSPTQASNFFGRLADEVEAACARGALQCTPQLVPEMPPMSSQRLVEGLRHNYLMAFNTLFQLDFPDGTAFQSRGNRPVLSQALHFLHYPLHTRSRDWFTTYTFSGWYYSSGSDWISIAVRKSDGSAADVQFARYDSPDIAAHFNDNYASRQRYVIQVACDARCVLQLHKPDGNLVSQEFEKLLKAPIAIAVGKGIFYIDSAAPVAEVAYQLTPADAAASRIRAAVFALYKYLFVPFFILGAIAFAIATLSSGRRALGNVCYVMAFASWLLALSRFGFLLLVAATSFPAIMMHFMAPAYFMLVCGAVFSCAAWLQLFDRRPLSVCKVDG